MKRPLFSSLAGAAVLALALAGCAGDSGGGSATGGDTGGNAASSTADIAAAQEVLDQALLTPSSIGYDEPISGEIPTDVHVAVLEVPVAVNQAQQDERQKLMDELGWKFTRIVVGGGPEDPAIAFDRALDLAPDAIEFSGYDPAGMTEQLKRAEEMGVIIIAQSIPYNAPTPEYPMIDGIDRALRTVEHSAKMTAAYMVADSGGTANIEIFTVPSQVIIVAYVEAIQKYIDEWCPDCTVNTNDFEFTDIGSNLPGTVVSALQRNPEAGYVVLGLGDASVGVSAAIDGAGFGDQVKIGGGIPSPENYEALRAGTQHFWAADTSFILLYKETDMMIRLLLGEDISTLNDAIDVTQLLTPENINDTAFNEDGYWIGYADYKADYDVQWNRG